VVRNTVDGLLDGQRHATMVTACGRRGPMRPREDLGRWPANFILTGLDADPLICADCLVLWDAAEEKGRLLVRWVSTYARQWAAAGAVLFLEAPSHVCAKCRERRRDYVALSVLERAQ